MNTAKEVGTAEGNVTKQDLEMLSAGAHTAESFGRAIIASALAAAAEKGETFVSGRAIKLQLNVSVTLIKGIGAWVCVGVPGAGMFLHDRARGTTKLRAASAS